MGLLDDAIREHLELKRRRGADPAEVERAEREALGPVRRGPQEPSQVLADDDERFAYDHEADEGWEDDGWEEPFEEEFDPEGAAAQGPDAPTAYYPKAEGLLDEPFVEEYEFEDEESEFEDFHEEHRAGTEPGGHPSSGPVAQPHEERVEDETAEYDVELDEALEDLGPGAAGSEQPRESPGAEHGHQPAVTEDEPGREHAGDEEDDVLEETPDFLQDTPDHDRLWFEQRPPRDFDFGG